MQKIFNFIVDKKGIILSIFIILAIVSIVLIPKVNINTDMTKYLPADSSTKKGVELMDNNFTEMDSDNSSFRMMIKDLNETEKIKIYDDLSAMENIESVEYELNNEKYNTEDYSLYFVNIPFAAESPETKEIVESVDSTYKSYNIELSGSAIGDSFLDILSIISPIALVIMLIILFIMCSSWIEPFIFLITIAIAVLINMGSNIMFESVSEITYAIAAVLQLVLSMDYSIMLLNRYRQEKRLTDDNSLAMKKALRNAFTSISSSSITTIVGMLALVFMSFTIGKDLGFVLAKGVFMSLLCIFTVLPGLILLFDKSLEKTAKKALHIKMDKIAKFSFSARYVIIIVFVVLFGVSFLLRGGVDISYTLPELNEINKVFKPENPIVVLYENDDEEKVTSLTAEWENIDSVNEVNGYSTTLGKELSYEEMADAMEMDETLIAQMYYYYSGLDGNKLDIKLTTNEFVQFLSEDVANNEQFSEFISEDDLARLSLIPGAQNQEQRLSNQEFAALSRMDEAIVEQIYGYYFMLYGQTEDGKIEMNSLVQFLTNDVATNEEFAPYFTAESMQQLSALSAVPEESQMDNELSNDEIAEYFGMENQMAEQLFNYYAITNGDMPDNKISLYSFINFIADDVSKDEQFQQYFSEDNKEQLDDAKDQMNKGYEQLVGEKYSRIIINTSLDNESDETFNFVENLQKNLDTELSNEHYIIGDSAMAYEMSQTFPSELNYITILTIVAVFAVVLIAFRSLSVPAVLVSLIQCAIFLTMGVTAAQGDGIYYLPLLIVQCLLLGATVDYGILYTSYYREARQTMEKKEAIVSALNNSIHTIMTSALILVAVTGALGFILAKSDPSISDILVIVATGGICSSALVVFILPGIVSALDRFTIKKAKQ